MRLNCHFLFIISLLSTHFLEAHNSEFSSLRNIKQVTFPSMGFEKAGESYFSPDGKTLLFQAVPKGKKGYQIYSVNVETGEPRLG